MTDSAAPGIDRQGARRRWLIDLAIAIAVLAASGSYATSFWNEWTARGGRGVFYQSYFEPAVMIACGKGWVISHPQPKPLEDFLFQRVDSFACSDIPADATLNTRYLYQGAWRYLLYTVGWTWRMLGISWSGMGAFFGVLFGITTAVAYGTFRLCARRPIALAACGFLTISSLQLLNLPHLRDYAKAPFTLALVGILAALIIRPRSRRAVIALSALYGAVLGLGYGFRTDFLIDVPLLPIVVFVFLGPGLLQRLPDKALAVAAFAATFALIGGPIVKSVYSSGGCQWHVTLLGLQSPFNDALHIEPAPYDYGHAYADGYIDRIVNGFRWRKEPSAPRLVYCSHDYDVESGDLLTRLIKNFPSDFITRAYAAAFQSIELPVNTPGTPMQRWHPRIYEARARLLGSPHRWGLLFGVVAIAIAAAASVRQGVAMLFLFAYLGGYPAAQFQERHYFHLEFMGWWAIALVADCTVTAFLQWHSGTRPLWHPGPALARIAVVGAGAVILAVTALQLARWHQSTTAKDILQSFIDAPKVAVEAPEAPLQGIAPTAWPQLLEVDLDQGRCAESTTVNFTYPPDPAVDFKRTVPLPARPGREGITRIFQPVFEHYSGLVISDRTPGCVVAVSRVADLTKLPVVLGATLPPDWKTTPLYQRLADWEGRRDD